MAEVEEEELDRATVAEISAEGRERYCGYKDVMLAPPCGHAKCLALDFKLARAKKRSLSKSGVITFEGNMKATDVSRRITDMRKWIEAQEREQREYKERQLKWGGLGAGMASYWKNLLPSQQYGENQAQAYQEAQVRLRQYQAEEAAARLGAEKATLGAGLQYSSTQK